MCYTTSVLAYSDEHKSSLREEIVTNTPTTDERLSEIERLISELHKDQQDFARRDMMHDEHITILLGQVVTLVPEVRRLHERLDEQSRELAVHTVLLNQHTDLLQQILAKLP